MKRRLASCAAATLAFATLAGASGCDALADDSTDGVTVVAGFYPLAYAASRVAGDHAEVESLARPGVEPHDASLTIRETAEVDDADVVVLARGFQPSLDDAVDNSGGDGVVVDPMSPGFHTSNSPAIRRDNPHFWLDPLLMADLGDAVADALSEADPAHADDYAGNAADLRLELQRLDMAYADGLADCERSTVVVSHDAFGYLDRYGLRFEPVAGLSPEAEPTPADLARLHQLIRDEGITTVFTERLVSSRLTRTLADDLGVDTAVLDPVEGLTDETADEDYFSIMRENLAALEEANGC